MIIELAACVPFLFSIWIKTVSHFFLRGIRRRAIEGIPGSDPCIKDGKKVELILDHLSHGDQKALLIATYFGSLVSGVAIAVRSGVALWQLLTAATVLGAIGVGLVFFLNSREPGSLDEPLAKDDRDSMPASRMLYFANIAVDVVLLVLSLAAILPRLRSRV